MISALILVIYLVFISLGLPDSLLGSAWPIMSAELGEPLSAVGIVTMIIAGGTIISSLFSARIIRKLGTSAVTAISVLMTAVALLGFSVSHSFVLICVWAVPYGLGAGAVDAALNNYVAVNFSSKHMSWLHCFWGVGAAVSPYIMGFCLSRGFGWNSGYRTVSILQFILTAVLFLSLPLWKKDSNKAAKDDESEKKETTNVIKIAGVKCVLLAFFSYCALETTAGLWASSYLVNARGVEANTAAKFASLFFIGITVGRFLCGFVTEKLGDKMLIKIGLGVISAGILVMWLPVEGNALCLLGLVVIGFGCAPVYPSIIHATPHNFGKENSQAIIGIQMASAYTGSTFMPPLFGLIAQYVSIKLYPAYLVVFLALMIAMTELLNEKVANKNKCN